MQVIDYFLNKTANHHEYESIEVGHVFLVEESDIFTSLGLFRSCIPTWIRANPSQTCQLSISTQQELLVLGRNVSWEISRDIKIMDVTSKRHYFFIGHWKEIIKCFFLSSCLYYQITGKNNSPQNCIIFFHR